MRQRLSSILAHEYTHYLQHELSSTFHPIYKIFLEGHAMGVQKHITESLAEEKKDFAYVQQTNELQWHLEAALKLFKEHHEERKKKDPIKLVLGHSHSIGHALFQMAERKHGKGIYIDAMKGNYSFLE